MEQNSIEIDNLKANVHQLMNKYAELESEKIDLEGKLGAVKNQIAIQNSEINALNEKYKVLKMAKSLEGSSSENREVKLKINEMVREIDKCIALLNK